MSFSQKYFDAYTYKKEVKMLFIALLVQQKMKMSEMPINKN